MISYLLVVEQHRTQIVIHALSRPIMSIDVVEVVIWRESSVSGGSGAVQMFLRWQQRSEERFSRNAETDLVCRLLLEKKKEQRIAGRQVGRQEDAGRSEHSRTQR